MKNRSEATGEHNKVTGNSKEERIDIRYSGKNKRAMDDSIAPGHTRYTLFTS